MNLEGSSNLLFKNNFTRGKTFPHHTFSKRDQKFYTRSVRECRFSPSAPYHHQHTVHPFTTTTRKTEETKHPPPNPSQNLQIHQSPIYHNIISYTPPASYHTIEYTTTTPLNTHPHSTHRQNPPPSPYARKPRTYKSIPLPAPNSRSRFQRFCRPIEL